MQRVREIVRPSPFLLRRTTALQLRRQATVASRLVSSKWDSDTESEPSLLQCGTVWVNHRPLQDNAVSFSDIT